MKLSDVRKNSSVYSSASAGLDLRLKGGFKTGCLYDVFGTAGSGKVDLVLNAVIDCLVSSGRVLWLSSGSRFPLQRILDIFPDISLSNLCETRVSSCAELAVLLSSQELHAFDMCVIYELSDLASGMLVEFDRVFQAQRRTQQKRLLERQMLEEQGEIYSSKQTRSMVQLGPKSRVLRNIHELMVLIERYAIENNVCVITVGATEAQYKSFENEDRSLKRSMLVPVISAFDAYYRERIAVFRDWDGSKTASFCIISNERIRL